MVVQHTLMGPVVLFAFAPETFHYLSMARGLLVGGRNLPGVLPRVVSIHTWI